MPKFRATVTSVYLVPEEVVSVHEVEAKDKYEAESIADELAAYEYTGIGEFDHADYEIECIEDCDD